jgi:D-alanyl-D-alanine-carboxypeptidase/D-alanyl-D-alanine-endopeptidase
MMLQGEVTLEEPVRELLPRGLVPKPSGVEITLLDLATHRSGLPRLPDNAKPADSESPYADYSVSSLFAYLAKHGVEKPADTGYSYSNLGFGVLGQALANRAGTSYTALLKRQVLDPIGMTETSISPSAEQRQRLLTGYSAAHQPVRPWERGALESAGGLRSSATDMLKFLQAQLHPESLATVSPPEAHTLPAAIRQSQILRADGDPETRIALAWNYSEETYWHGGDTAGFSSTAMFDLDRDLAIVVLFNTQRDRRAFAETLADHVYERMVGKQK